jgi:hypothetical protein
MSYTKIALGIAACAVISVGGWSLFSGNTNTQTSTQQILQVQNPRQLFTVPLDQISEDQPNSSRGINLSELVASPDVNEQIETAMQSYAEISKYPPHSQPIVSEEHINSFINATVPESSLPYPFTDLEKPIQLSLKLEKYNYFFGDSISATIELSDIPDNASVSSRSVLMDLNGEVLAESGVELKDDANDNKSMTASFDSSAYDTSAWPLEMNLGAYLDVNGHQLFISAPFRINTTTATLESIGFSEAKSENLIIPVNLNVSLAGYYYVAAILYSAQSHQPLIYLETEGSLASGASTLNLRAHIQALKKGGDEGPYLLEKIRVERWSDEIIPMDVAGQVNQESFAVEGYQFDAFEDIPYIDPLNEERIRLMEGLSSL